MHRSPDIVVTAEQIAEKLAHVAKQISSDYVGKEPVFVGVLKGAFMLMADLVRLVDLPLTVDFMAIASYGSRTKTSGVLRILKDLDTEIEGRDVVVIEDIVDSGLTLKYLLRNLKARNPASLEVFALFVKDHPRKRQLAQIKYAGFNIATDFVVGYGLDHDQRYRNLPYVKLFEGPKEA